MVWGPFGEGLGRILASKLELSWPKIRSIIDPTPFGNELVMTGGFGEGLGRILGGLGHQTFSCPCPAECAERLQSAASCRRQVLGV